MSRPYGLELFLQRPLYSLYRFAGTEALRIKGEVKIVEAAHLSLQRSADGIYEPIVVELEDGIYRLLDVYQLLLAQSKIHQMTTQLLEKANRELERLANCDSLTGVANRYRFDEYLNSYWQQHFGSTSLLSLIMCDVDYFKAYNDTYGHQAGDECLRKVATAIRGTVKRPTDLVARYGGEEFAVILPFTSISDAINLAEKIRHSVKALAIPHSNSTAHCGVTISMGVASILPTPQVLPASLIAAADAALYQAKSSGRDLLAAALAPSRYFTSAFK
jgi:diguanylate cyclase (GGDEF)-like protein